MNSWLPHVELAGGEEGSRACLRRSGIPVSKVLEFLAHEPDAGRAASLHPEVSREEFLACIAFAADPDAHARLVEEARSEAVPAAISL